MSLARPIASGPRSSASRRRRREPPRLSSPPVAGLFVPGRLTRPHRPPRPRRLGATSPGSLSLISRVGLSAAADTTRLLGTPGSSEFRVGSGLPRTTGASARPRRSASSPGCIGRALEQRDASLPSGDPIFAGRPVTGVRWSFSLLAPRGQKGCAGRSRLRRLFFQLVRHSQHGRDILPSWLLSYMSRLFSSTPRNSGARGGELRRRSRPRPRCLPPRDSVSPRARARELGTTA